MATNTQQQFSLLREKNFIGGKWIPAVSGLTFPVTNPANDEVIGVAPESSLEDAENAIDAATARFKQWAAVPGKERGNLLKSLWKLLNSHVEDLARLVTAESGKALAESRAEVAFAVGSLHSFMSCSMVL